MSYDDKITELLLSIAQLTNHIKSTTQDSIVHTLIDAVREEISQLVETSYANLEDKEKDNCPGCQHVYGQQ